MEHLTDSQLDDLQESTNAIILAQGLYNIEARRQWCTELDAVFAELRELREEKVIKTTLAENEAQS